VTDWFASLTQSDWIGIVGVVISLLGFGLAIIQIRKATSAAQSATNAAKEAEAGIRRVDGLLEVATVSEGISAIKRAIRSEAWDQISGLIDGSRKSLILTRGSNLNLSDEKTSRIGEALVFLSILEVDLMKLGPDEMKKKKPNLIKTLIEISDAVTTIITEAKINGPRQ
jgi:hypothetical protein